MKSMTGFGRATGTGKDIPVTFRIELSSINRKQFELKFSMPREIAFYESKLRMLMSTRISRGSVMMRVDFDSNASTSTNASIRINTDLAGALLQQADLLKQHYGLQGEITIADILSLPGVIENGELDYSMPEVEELLCSVALEALENMLKMRSLEGENLKKDIVIRLEILEKTLDRIIPHAVEIPRLQQERLLQRIKDSGLDADPKDERLLRELVIFADRCDVSEEITRLKSHFEHFHATLEDNDNPVGRSLDFMVQEMFREINTLGNKAMCMEVSPLIVIMKTELEKIREQVQNIE